LSTKIHAVVDGLGTPTALALTPGQAYDLDGADALLPGITASTIIADKRMIVPAMAAGMAIVIPPKRNRRIKRVHDKHLL
jgi:transposase